jgi:integrase
LRLKTGGSVQQISFSDLRTAYLRHIRATSKSKYHSDTIDRHYFPFWVKYKDVSKITFRDVNDYLEYRCGKVDRRPSNITLNRELTVLRQMFNFAEQQGWTSKKILVSSLPEKNFRRRRDYFDPKQYEALYTTALKRSEEACGSVKQSLPQKMRVLLFDYITILANTGMRVDEIKTVTWRQVDLAKGFITLSYAGKTQSTRRLVIRKYGVQALNRIRQRRLEFLAAAKRELDPNELVIAHPNGTPVRSFKKGFNELLKACGFTYADPRQKHTLTSLRHTYATKRLTTDRGKRATMESLAVQMGTSMRMIERHYGHLDIDDFDEELRGL